jgi:hypothetical protein
MNTRAPTLRERIEEVEARVAQRQERLRFQWHETQRATRALARAHRTLPLVSVGVAILAGYLLLRRPQHTAKAAKAGGMLGLFVAAGLALIRPRYGALYSLAWQLLSRRRPLRQT